MCLHDCLVQRYLLFERYDIYALQLRAAYTMCRKMLAQDTACHGFDATCRKCFKFNCKLCTKPLNNEIPTKCWNKSSDAAPCCEGYYTMIFT